MLQQIKIITIFCLMSFTLTTAQDFILVHGWTGNGNVWNNTGVKQYLQNDYPNHTIRQPTLGGTLSANSQAINLSSYLSSYSVTNGIGVVHSMGGITSRNYLKNQYQSGQLQRISKLFTIGTPHLGTKLADNRDAALHLLIAGAYAAVVPAGFLEDGTNIILHGASYTFLDVAYCLLYNAVLKPIVDETGGAAMTDLEASNPSNAVSFINTGTSYENNITKVGIAGTEIDPVLYRMAAHIPAVGFTEDYILQCVDYIEDYKMLLVLYAAFNFVEDPDAQKLETLCREIALYSFFKDLNELWKTKILQATESDGVVSISSQIYPNYNRQYYADYSSHMEQKDHENIISRLREGFIAFGVQPPLLSISISGPTQLASGVTGYFNSSVIGGITPYHYNWQMYVPSLIRALPTNLWVSIGTDSPNTNISYTRDFKVRCRVTDATNTTITSNEIYVHVSGSRSMQLSKDSDEQTDAPESTRLEQNHPNPFNPSTVIKYSLSEPSFVSLKVFDTLGQEVANLVNEQKPAGSFITTFNAADFPSGLYIYKLQTNSLTEIKKMLLVK